MKIKILHGASLRRSPGVHARLMLVAAPTMLMVLFCKAAWRGKLSYG